MMDKKKLPLAIAFGLIVLVIVFYAGRLSVSSRAREVSRQNFASGNLLGQQGRSEGTKGVTRGRMGQGGINMVGGEIIGKDEKSITVKLSDGGSKIIYFSDSTVIDRLDKATFEDLMIGRSVSVNGMINNDGSLSAQIIQLKAMETTTEAMIQLPLVSGEVGEKNTNE